MVISIRAELPEDFVLTVRDDSGGAVLFRTSTDVEDLKEWNLGTKKEIQIDIDSETGIILGWKPTTVKQVNKKKSMLRDVRVLSQQFHTIPINPYFGIIISMVIIRGNLLMLV